MSIRTMLEVAEGRLNPVFVKEVRQSLRGKKFRSTFGFVLIASLVIAILVVQQLADDSFSNPIGPALLISTFSCLTIAVIGFVPFLAFNAMGAEFEENTYDLLILSQMRPRQIMLGKLLAAGVQSLLYFSVFGFFTVFAFLLGGVDLMTIIVSLLVLAGMSLSLSSLALGLSSLSNKRFVRSGLSVLLVTALVGSVFAAIGMQSATVNMGLDLGEVETQLQLALILVFELIVGSLFFAIGAAQLSHEEENRSTGLRVLGFISILAVLAFAVSIYYQLGVLEALVTFSMLGIFLGSIMATFFATEREALGRRVRATLPKRKLTRIFLSPWLPGGARGALWLLGLNALIFFSVSWFVPFSRSMAVGAKSTFHAEQGVLVACSYSVIYVLLPGVFFSNRKRTLKGSTIMRIGVVALFGLGLILPTMYGFLMDDFSLGEGEHFGNPFWMIMKVVRGDLDPFPIFIAALIVALLQLPRVVRSFKELLSIPCHD